MKKSFIIKTLFVIFASIQHFNMLYADVQEVGSMSEFEATLENMYSYVNPSETTNSLFFHIHKEPLQSGQNKLYRSARGMAMTERCFFPVNLIQPGVFMFF